MTLLWAACLATAEQSVWLTSTATGNRWLDVAGQPYAQQFIDTFNYSNSVVRIDFSAGQSLTGLFTAQGLKPNFAYQLKLEGHHNPSPHPSNELIGWHGRWWQEIWNGAYWASGGNLNSKGSAVGGLGEWPSPNDIVYMDRKDDPDASSPTGLHYRYMAYRPFEYFITDHDGAADFTFTINSTYHVLWKTSQRAPGSYDGPAVNRTFAVDASQHPAYDANFPSVTVSVFGEWERLPMHKVPLLTGDYACDMMLTEESFHGVDGTNSGLWAAAVRASIQFTVLPAATVIMVH